jgi:hypothetical protein
VLGLFVGPVALALYGSIGTSIALAVLDMSHVPEAFTGNGVCLLGPVIGAVTGLVTAALVSRWRRDS